jgi:nucleoside-diphosphate-sugar epimerase
MITLLGSSGFIGRHLKQRLEELKMDYFSPGRGEALDRPLGGVIYCIGLTADFRSRPCDTIDAHVCALVDLLRNHDYESILYLSSTRLYRSDQLAHEDIPLRANPSDPNDLYNISKLMGESLLLSSAKKARVARVSNVYGNDFTSQNFLSSLLKDAVTKGSIFLETSPDSEKDYVNIKDVVDGLIGIALEGRQRIYNLAGGTNVSHSLLVSAISKLTNCEIATTPGAPAIKMPPISIERMENEFGYKPSSVLDDLDGLVQSYVRHYGDAR